MITLTSRNALALGCLLTAILSPPATQASVTEAPDDKAASISPTWLSFEGSANLGFGSGGGYSMGPGLAYTPQIKGVLRPCLTVAPRFAFQLFKSPAGVAPLFALGSELWIHIKDQFYVAPGISLAMAVESDSTQFFPSFSGTAGYHLRIDNPWLKMLDRVLLRYEAYISPDATHQLSVGFGINFR